MHQLKKGTDFEIYEMDYSSNNQLQDVCNIKQPVLFEYKNINPNFFHDMDDEHLDILNPHDVKVKDIRDYYKDDIDSVDYTFMTYQSADTLITSDTKSSYFTENNHSLADDAGMLQTFQSNDEFLKPPFTVITNYDILTGSKKTHTPLRYHTNERHMICVISGKLSIKMTPYKNSKYVYPNKDYDMYEFWSPINVWKPQRKYFNEMNKMKFIEFDVMPGYIINIPPYWWYSIQFNDTNTICTSFTYNSVMNCIANIPNTCLYFMQQQNIKKRVTKIITDTTDSHDNDDDTESITIEDTPDISNVL
uniref:Cupin-like domain-containing protein n=1 Tax=viral metagenome TaxID=1070528 RepID=A0A6C0J3U6_9ZZZZ